MSEIFCKNCTDLGVDFGRWLRLQEGRDVPIGDLASDAIRDPEFPWGSHISVVESYLRAKGRYLVMDAFRDAVGEWFIQRLHRRGDE